MSQQVDKSLSLANPSPRNLSNPQKLGLGLVGIGLAFLIVALFGGAKGQSLFFLISSLSTMSIGGLLYGYFEYKGRPAGIKNHGVMFFSESSKGVWGWIIGITLTTFYVFLYWFPEYMAGLISIFDPLSHAIGKGNASNWFMYGVFYTVAILVMGVKFLYKYRHNRYQMIRTGSVMFFQLGFAFLLPNILYQMKDVYYDWTSIWPLRYYELFPNSVNDLLSHGGLGKFMVFWGVISILLITPILTYFFGKRWYCSWVCGCGGLAETAGDSFRHLSDKSLKAWKVERWLIYSILVLIVLVTGFLWAAKLPALSSMQGVAGEMSKWYGFFIGAIFSGIIGVGFYPLMGSRVWCRFGCPMAAFLGLQQRFFSRFRITTNGGQCISCGNCSTYCEMGIDVRAYAQKGQNIVRASCVGCGICAAVCPRGVLKLENGPDSGQSRVEEGNY